MNAPFRQEALWDQPDRYPAALACSICPLRSKCGGIHCKGGPLDCHDFCCGGLEGCSIVCRRNPRFIDQYAEADGFSLTGLANVPAEPCELSTSIVPMLYHGANRLHSFSANRVALRLRDVADLRTGELRFRDRKELCDALRISPGAELIISGVDHDPQVEAVWRLSDRRRAMFSRLSALSPSVITTPNFSLVLDRPRPDNLHAMHRIAVVYNELAEVGLPVALHPNSRTQHDMERWWIDFIESRTSISWLSYEFITGSGLKDRLDQHCDWLNRIASKRPMGIIVRGNPNSIDLLNNFERIVYIETTSFMKAVNRQWPMRSGNDRLHWAKKEGLIIDSHLEMGWEENRIMLQARHRRFES